MRFIILILAWVTPAVIAGILGWKGIWGAGSAFIEYLIPIPVAGGVFHVPSFLAVISVVIYGKNLPASISRYLPVLAFAVFLVAQTLQLDFDRINAWLFTDYNPSLSPFKFNGNPLYLFIATDAIWIGVYALLRGYTASLRTWLLLVLVPVAVIGVQAVIYKAGGPSFKIGGSSSVGKVRGNELFLVYTSSSYDEKAFLEWMEAKGKGYFTRPWDSSNYEHAAIIFTNSMQLLKWRKFDAVDNNNTVATICLYEENRTITEHKGYYDCFKGHQTVDERMRALVSRNPSGLSKNIDYWYALLQLCDGVKIPDRSVVNISLFNMCKGANAKYKRNLNQYVERHGEDSNEVKFLRSKAEEFGLKIHFKGHKNESR